MLGEKVAEIHKRQNNPGPGIDYGEIYISDGQYLGTGRYTLALQPNALVNQKVIAGIMINQPIFQISVNINPGTKEVPVLLGRADGSDPISQKLFSLPQNIGLAGTHRFEAIFEGWEIKALKMNGMSLPVKTQSGSINFWVDPAKNPKIFQKGINYKFGPFDLRGEKCLVVLEGKIISVVMNQGTKREIVIFTSELDPDITERHMITVTWNSKQLNLYFDADCVGTINLTDFIRE